MLISISRRGISGNSLLLPVSQWNSPDVFMLAHGNCASGLLPCPARPSNEARIALFLARSCSRILAWFISSRLWHDRCALLLRSIAGGFVASRGTSPSDGKLRTAIVLSDARRVAAILIASGAEKSTTARVVDSVDADTASGRLDGIWAAE